MNEILELAIAAFRAERYPHAIELLMQVTDNDPNNWMARHYLATAYHKSGRVVDAQRLFKRLTTCPDQVVAQKATATLPEIEEEVRRRFTKESLIDNKDKVKKTVPAKPRNPLDDMVWVG